MAVTHEGCGTAVNTCPDEVSQNDRSSLPEARTRASLLKHQSVSRSLSDCHSSCLTAAGSQCRNRPGSSTVHRLPSGAKVMASMSPSRCKWRSPKTWARGTAFGGKTVTVMRASRLPWTGDPWRDKFAWPAFYADFTTFLPTEELLGAGLE